MEDLNITINGVANNSSTWMMLAAAALIGLFFIGAIIYDAVSRRRKERRSRSRFHESSSARRGFFSFSHRIRRARELAKDINTEFSRRRQRIDNDSHRHRTNKIS